MKKSKDKKKKYSIYRINNKVNGKIYIGITCNAVSTRWIQHKSDANRRINTSTLLHNAIRKYGIDSFFVEEIFKSELILSSEAIVLEKNYIKENNSFNKEIGYNMTVGGDGVVGHESWCKGKTKETDPRIRRISEKQKGKNNSFYGKTHTKELKEKWSKSRSGKNHPMYGTKKPSLAEANKKRIWTDEARAKISAKNSKPIICIELNQTFFSVKSMCEELNLDGSSVYKVINGKIRHHRGFTFKYPK